MSDNDGLTPIDEVDEKALVWSLWSDLSSIGLALFLIAGAVLTSH